MTGRELQRYRSLVIAFIYFLFAFYAARRAIFENLRPADIAVAIAFHVVMTTFCIVDSKCRGKPLLHSFYWIIFFSWPVSVPIYWIWTRGLRGILSAVLFTVSLLIISIAAFVATAILTGSEPWLQ